MPSLANTLSNIYNTHTVLAICNILQNNTCLPRTTTPNHTPIVKVGPNQTVNENTTVMLVGLSYDQDQDV